MDINDNIIISINIRTCLILRTGMVISHPLVRLHNINMTRIWDSPRGLNRNLEQLHYDLTRNDGLKQSEVSISPR